MEGEYSVLYIISTPELQGYKNIKRLLSLIKALDSKVTHIALDFSLN